jgi:hypothetical protein
MMDKQCNILISDDNNKFKEKYIGCHYLPHHGIHVASHRTGLCVYRTWPGLWP